MGAGFFNVDDGGFGPARYRGPETGLDDDIFGQNGQQPKTFLTPQEQVQQSRANGGILRLRGQQPSPMPNPGSIGQPGGPMPSLPVEKPDFSKLFRQNFGPKPYDPNMGGTPELYDQFNRANNRMTMEVLPTDGMNYQEYVNYNNMPTEQREAYAVNRMQNRFQDPPGTITGPDMPVLREDPKIFLPPQIEYYKGNPQQLTPPSSAPSGQLQQPKTFLTPQEQVQQPIQNMGGPYTPRPDLGPNVGFGPGLPNPQDNNNYNNNGFMGGGMPQQDNQQYYQQMRENMQGMDKALKELEGIQTPGGKYNTVGGMGQGSAGKSGK